MENPHPLPWWIHSSGLSFILWLAYLTWLWWLRPPLKRLWWLYEAANPLIRLLENIEAHEARREPPLYVAQKFGENAVAQAYRDYRKAQKSADKAVRKAQKSINQARRDLYG